MASKVVVMHDTLDNAVNQPSMQTMCSCWEPEQSYMDGLLMDGSTLLFVVLPQFSAICLYEL